MAAEVGGEVAALGILCVEGFGGVVRFGLAAFSWSADGLGGGVASDLLA